MEREIFALPSAGFWVLALNEGERTLGYWAGGPRMWVSIDSDADITLWHTAESAAVYRARNLEYLLSARIVQE